MQYKCPKHGEVSNLSYVKTQKPNEDEKVYCLVCYIENIIEKNCCELEVLNNETPND